ncbi:uncharacterized protein LOC111325756 isoform X1 [Stylophora pistillata]|uniref:uncharacterized protein LOC111325756 isoform X1 n=1 Tax=Stylophora pistillata TaxID=50429 RepID=UPI000C04B43B|nr:uncharacterized protein LOC111325756 isoform X1 [Stylophora pistillata]XP_022785361.1 uncharacterized protein LOC111325756 isoform X1 [Stylophora pistillata]
MYLKLGFLLVLFSIVLAENYFERDEEELRDPVEELREGFVKTKLADPWRYRYRYRRARRLGCFKGKRKVCTKHYGDDGKLRYFCKCVSQGRDAPAESPSFEDNSSENWLDN